MAHLGKFIAELLQNAGYDIEANSEGLGTVLSIDTDIPDEAASHVKQNLLTVESAKNNPDIKKHFTAQALNTVDTTLSDFAESYGDIPAEKLAEINAEKSSYKKTTMMLNALKEAEAAKASGKGGADEETQKQLKARKERIEQLQQELNSMKSNHEQALTNAQKEAQNKILNYALNAELGMRDFANSDLDKSTNVMIARQIVDGYLREQGALPVSSEDGSIRLVRSDDPEMDFMLENKKISYGSLADRILSEKKLIKVTDPNAGAGGNGQNGNAGAAGAGAAGNGGGAGAPISQEASQMYADQIAALTGANA